MGVAWTYVTSGILSLFLFLEAVNCQFPIPARYDGFPFSGTKTSTHPIVLEAFYDFLCPSCKAAWPVVKQLPKIYGKNNLQIIIHPFPAPFHHNAFFAARGAHVISAINSSLTFPWIDLIFKHQDEFENDVTASTTPHVVVERLARVATKLGIREEDFLAGFGNPDTDYLTRISFKYGCSRGVVATPTYLVNGVYVIGADDSWTLKQWQELLDPLVKATPSNARSSFGLPLQLDY